MRRKVIAGNWKMNMLPAETIKFMEELSFINVLKLKTVLLI